MVIKTNFYVSALLDMDNDAIEQLHKWNNINNWGLFFYDTKKGTFNNNYFCTIKNNVSIQLKYSHVFILIVGDRTKNLTHGSCLYCNFYNSWKSECLISKNVDIRSFVDYECENAIESGLDIIVLYNDIVVDRNKCPESIKHRGTHKAMREYKDGLYQWNYNSVYSALGLK
ncbi:MAG: molecular chaperone Tir [Bacteroidales bacterium]|jgi:hypothetical protein|nr:molecular chaperone Tir [Bacteroidales bacterium]